MRISDWSSDVCSSDLQAVDLVDDDDVDQPGLDVFKQGFQPRPFERSAGIPAVVVTFAHAYPPLSALACDIGLAGLALVLAAVELHVHPLFAVFSGVDGATTAPLPCRSVCHAASLRSRRPNKAAPFPCVPAIMR